MSSQLVRPNLNMRTMQLNAWVDDNLMNIEIFFYLLYYNVITLKCKKITLHSVYHLAFAQQGTL